MAAAREGLAARRPSHVEAGDCSTPNRSSGAPIQTAQNAQSAAGAATAAVNIQPKIEAINPSETSQGSTLLATTVALTSPNRYS